MKIVETVEVVNGAKVIMGPKVVKLEFDTETGRVALNTPAMFTDPVVKMDELQEKLMALSDAARGQ
jgi:hypothetical protein